MGQVEIVLCQDNSDIKRTKILAEGFVKGIFITRMRMETSVLFVKKRIEGKHFKKADIIMPGPSK